MRVSRWLGEWRYPLAGAYTLLRGRSYRARIAYLPASDTTCDGQGTTAPFQSSMVMRGSLAPCALSATSMCCPAMHVLARHSQQGQRCQGCPSQSLRPWRQECLPVACTQSLHHAAASAARRR